MKIIILNSKNQLNAFLTAHPHSEFSQAWEWGEYQEKCGHKIFRLGVEDEGGLIAAITFINVVLPLGFSYFYAPRGPVFECRMTNVECRIKITKLLFDEINIIAKKDKCIFLRFEPDNSYNLQPTTYNLIKTIDVQPHRTSILDLTKTEEDILAAMHQKTRYNIRLAEKKGMEIIEAGEEQFDDFWKLMEETKDRDGFRLHGKEHYRKMISSRITHHASHNKNALEIKLFFAEYQGQIIAANIISFFGDTATYMHGASADSHRNLMAPYFLHWHIIKQAKDRGCKFYDLFGIDENKWPGVTRFKLGWGGGEKTYPGTFDFVFSKKWYNVYKFIRRIRRMS